MVSTLVVPSGEIRMDLKTRKFFIRDYEVFLRNKEFDLLYYLILNRGRVVTRTQILEEVWDRNICCSTNTVDVHVSTLRGKFMKHLNDRLIRTIHAIGYTLEI